MSIVCDVMLQSMQSEVGFAVPESVCFLLSRLIEQGQSPTSLLPAVPSIFSALDPSNMAVNRNGRARFEAAACDVILQLSVGEEQSHFLLDAGALYVLGPILSATGVESLIAAKAVCEIVASTSAFAALMESPAIHPLLSSALSHVQYKESAKLYLALFVQLCANSVPRQAALVEFGLLGVVSEFMLVHWSDQFILKECTCLLIWLLEDSSDTARFIPFAAANGLTAILKCIQGCAGDDSMSSFMIHLFRILSRFVEVPQLAVSFNSGRCPTALYSLVFSAGNVISGA